jgi:YebC/PmpR family DNA-binding regulatory protein
MSGHSKWSTIKHKKGAADAKRAKMFTKLQREILVAAKIGQPDPDFNPRLRSAIIAARAENMPKDKIESTIKKATSAGEGENYVEMRYEGYGPSGVAIIVEALTDNKNRTAAEVRSAFTKSGGSLGETGSVGFMFDRVGVIGYEGSVASEDDMFEVAVEAGAESIESSKEWHEVICQPESLNKVRDALITKFGDPKEAKLDWRAKTTTELNLEQAQKVMKLVDMLEDNDDIQSVTGNFEIPNDVAEKL